MSSHPKKRKVTHLALVHALDDAKFPPSGAGDLIEWKSGREGRKEVRAQGKSSSESERKEKKPDFVLFSSFSYLARLQRLRDHAHHALASVAHGLGHGAHQADVAACWFCFSASEKEKVSGF